MKQTNSEDPRLQAPIFLVGMMGAGKSTFGPALAERLNRSFVDTDDQVEAKAGCSISAIFEREGEAHFRSLERDAIDAASDAGAVVALGGGAFSQPGAAERLCKRGVVVFLDVSIDQLLARVGDGATRPLLAGLSSEARRAKLESLLKARSADYAKATFSVSAEGTTPIVIEEILAELEARSLLKPMKSSCDEEPRETRVEDASPRRNQIS